MIYLVEDDDNIQKLVCYALSKDGYEIKGFSEPRKFWNEMKNALPDIVLLDIMLPEEDGLTVLKKIRTNGAYKDIPVIMLTAKSSEFDKVTGLDAGADDYITKPFGVTELSARVGAVLRRYKRTATSEEYKIGDLYVSPEKHIIRVCNEETELSFKEYSLLLTLLEAKGKVVPREKLLFAVWGEYYGESRTLDVHIRNLRVKLKTAGKLIKTIKNIGYRIGEENDEL